MGFFTYFKKHRFTAVLVLIVIVGATTGYIVYSREDVPKFVTQAVERGMIRSQVGATGTLTAITTTQVGTQVSGTIDKWYSDFNDKVKNGQLLATIEPSLFKAAYEQSNANLKTAEADVINQKSTLVNAQANLEKAKIAVRDAKIKLDRAQGMLDSGLLAASDYDVAKINYESCLASQKSAEAQIDAQRSQIVSSEARVLVARANLSTAKLNLEHCKIFAPIEGVVVNRAIDVGQTVAASFQTPTLFTIANDLTKMQVFTNIDEADVGRIHESSPASFSVDAYPGENFRGRIAQIRLNPTTVQNVVTYTAVIQVDNPELKLKPGMTANVTILVAAKQDVLKIPNAAIRFIPPQSDDEKKAAGGTARPQQPGGGGPPSGGDRAQSGSGGGNRPGGMGGGAGGMTGGPGGGERRGGMGMGSSRFQAEQKVWLIDGKTMKLQPVTVKLGITDGIFTELVDGKLQEGDRVVVGQQLASTPRTGAQRSPTSPMGGGGRPMGGH